VSYLFLGLLALLPVLALSEIDKWAKIIREANIRAD
jgi:hypothetical protein